MSTAAIPAGASMSVEPAANAAPPKPTRKQRLADRQRVFRARKKLVAAALPFVLKHGRWLCTQRLWTAWMRTQPPCCPQGADALPMQIDDGQHGHNGQHEQQLQQQQQACGLQQQQQQHEQEKFNRQQGEIAKLLGLNSSRERLHEERMRAMDVEPTKPSNAEAIAVKAIATGSHKPSPARRPDEERNVKLLQE